MPVKVGSSVPSAATRHSNRLLYVLVIVTVATLTQICTRKFKTLPIHANRLLIFKIDVLHFRENMENFFPSQEGS